MSNPDTDSPGPPIGRVLRLSDTFVDSLGGEQLRGYLAALESVAQASHPHTDAASADLEARLAPLGIRMAPVEQRHIAEHLIGDKAAALTVLNGAGDILMHSDGAAHRPVGQSADPDDPARPALGD